MPTVLFGYDGSAAARHALTYASVLAAGSPAWVISVATAVTGGPYTDDFTDPAGTPEIHRKQAEEAAEMLRADGVEAATIVTIGNPAEEIIRAAEDRGVEVVVLGARGRSPLQRFLIGSVSDRVVRHASCDVLVVRAPRAVSGSTRSAGSTGSPSAGPAGGTGSAGSAGGGGSAGSAGGGPQPV